MTDDTRRLPTPSLLGARPVERIVPVGVTVKRLLYSLINHLVLLSIAIVFTAPLFWMISSSLKEPAEIFKYPPTLIPIPPQFSNYPDAWTAAPFSSYYLNSVEIAVSVVVGVVFFSSLAGYAFARMRFIGRDVVFGILLATMMVPYTVTLIPLYIIFKNIGWINTHYPLIIPPAIGNAFSIFLLRQFFLTLPKELEEAARIDGAGTFSIFIRIMLPLVKPALAAVAIFQFMGSWNNFLGPLIFLNDQEKMTLPIGLAMFRGEHLVQWNLLMAAAVFTIMPILIIYFFAQKYFIQGIALTGIKG